MRKNATVMLAGVVIGIGLFMCLCLLPVGGDHRQALAQVSVFESVAPTPSAHPSTSRGNLFSSTQSSWYSDPALLSVVLSALITGVLLVFQTVYQTHQNVKMQRESLASQGQQAQELAKLQAKYAEDFLRLQMAIEEQVKDQKRQEQQKEDLRQQMERVQTTRERAQIYRQALQEDPRIAYLQILDMNRPLAIMDIYVPIHVHRETHPMSDLNPAFLAAETSRHPNILLQTSQMFLDHRIGTASGLQEALRQHKRCVIIGDPGAGKSTILKYLALQAARSEFSDWNGLNLPIHIELSAFVGSGHQNLLEFAATQWQEMYGFPSENARSYIEVMLEQGKALLLLDALDETVIGETVKEAEASYRQVIDAIQQLSVRYQHAPIVVTARKLGYHQRLRLVGFTELEVLNFRQEDMEQFVNKWFMSSEASDKEAWAADLNNRLERIPRIRALATNPLLLSLIVQAYEAHLDLPERRAELYKRCVDTLLTTWDQTRKDHRYRKFSTEHKYQLLESLHGTSIVRDEATFLSTRS